jgi:hypothetical protein
MDQGASLIDGSLKLFFPEWKQPDSRKMSGY